MVFHFFFIFIFIKLRWMGSRINTAVDKFNLFRYRKQLTTYKMHLLACQFSLKHCVFFKLITLSFKTKLIIGNFLIINEKKTYVWYWFTFRFILYSGLSNCLTSLIIINSLILSYWSLLQITTFFSLFYIRKWKENGLLFTFFLNYIECWLKAFSWWH